MSPPVERPGPPAGGGRLGAIARLLCPRCRRGRIFAGPLRMHPMCPSCGLRFERESGYFVGAMYLSYALAIPAYLFLVLLSHLALRGRPLGVVLGAAAVPLAVLAPTLFRYARTLWIHLDRALHPDERK